MSKFLFHSMTPRSMLRLGNPIWLLFDYDICEGRFYIDDAGLLNSASISSVGPKVGLL